MNGASSSAKPASLTFKCFARISLGAFSHCFIFVPPLVCSSFTPMTAPAREAPFCLWPFPPQVLVCNEQSEQQGRL